MCTVDKILSMVNAGQCSTPAMYLTLVKQTPEDFAKMHSELKDRYQITFEARKCTVVDNQYDLYLIANHDQSMALVMQHATTEWLEDRGFILV